MGGSSDSGWQRTSDSFRRLNSSSSVSNRNPRFFGASTIKSSGDTSNNSGSVAGKRREDRVFNHLKSQVGFSSGCEDDEELVRVIECNDISLRQWLNNPNRSVDSLECLHIFTQVVEIVNLAHSQGIVVHNVRPSCFLMSSFNRVNFIESASCSDSGSDSYEDVSNSHTAELGIENFEFEKNSTNACQMVSETSCLQSSVDNDTRVLLEASNVEQAEENIHPCPMKHILLMENNWYTSPEEVAGAPSSCASDIYRLGVLLYELFCTFSSEEEKNATMSSLRHRLLPPKLLLNWHKQASFCLWLLHPEPTSRPKMGELLQSEFLNEPRDDIEEREAAIKLRERMEEEELLLEFLLLAQQRKEEAAANFHETISFLSSDIEEVTKLLTVRRKGGSSPMLGDSASRPLSMNINDDSGCSGSRKRLRLGFQIRNTDEFDGHQDKYQKPEPTAENQGTILNKSSRLMRNFKKLESAYFMTRQRAVKPTGKLSSDSRGSIAVNKSSSVNNLLMKGQCSEGRQSGWINSFLEGLCKYTSFGSLKVKADLKQGDLLNSSNLVCSLSFGREGDFFATAGVNKKIKVFEYDTILKENHDIHYPVVEMSSRSKLSSICWNRYIKSQIASSNFEGVVQVWDVATSQVFTEMKEHERRVWSVDFSLADPTLLASGSDDGSVKLWNINQGKSVGTIKMKANVCCVQFPSDSGNSLAFGSVDHNIYYYDLRNTKMPLCTLIGHKKTVSYVKFIDSTNLVSASTDNTLKLWDLSMGTFRVLDSPLQSFTGHTNVKNFVGLSVSEGYIATGSETNEVFIYHKALPMPALSFKFNSADPLSGDEVDDSGQFVSTVCWRGQSSTLVAANSMGNIKLLEMV